MSIVVVIAAMLESGLDRLTDPNYVTSLATLIAALTGLVVAVRASSAGKVTQEHVASTAAAVDKNSAVLKDVREQTNGGMADLRAEVAALKAQAVAAGLTPWPPAPAQPAGTVEASGMTGSSDAR